MPRKRKRKGYKVAKYCKEHNASFFPAKGYKVAKYCKEHNASFFPALLSVGCPKCEKLNKS